MAAAHCCLIVVYILLAVAYFFPHASSSSGAEGFSVKLIHRDSPESPLYDPSSTPFSRIHATINRFASRASHPRHGPSLNLDFRQLNDDGLSTSLTYDGFEYLMSFSIGTKMKNALAFMDTGSTLMWVLCYPCLNCNKRNGSLFNQRPSKSYKKVNCHSRHCSLLRRKSCNKKNICKYVQKYLDSSYVSGILSTETLGLQSATSNKIIYVKNIIIGCTHKTKGRFGDGGIGILGLSRGKLSLVSQLGQYYERSFSYCPPMVGKSSTFYFGSAGKVSGPGVMTTDLVGGIGNVGYEIILETITVAGAEDEPIIVSPLQGMEAAKRVGNIEIDSGTMITYINRQAMNDLLKVLKKKISVPPIPNRHNDLCYNISKGMNEVVPDIKFQFAGPAVLTLTRMNTFIIKKGDMFCLAI